jgi:hypothetical protein
MNARNPQYNAFGTIDLEIDHPVHGWIPFTADPHDAAGADLYEAAIAGDFGPVAEYVEPEPVFIQPTAAQIEALRKAAYQNEADPLYFKAQRGEATMDEWLAKIAEIKARYPEPDA